MKATQGKANPQMINKILNEILINNYKVVILYLVKKIVADVKLNICNDFS